MPFHGILICCLQNQKKTGPNNQKNSAQIFRFLIFRLWPLYPTSIKIGSKWPKYVLKHSEMQSETRGVQSFVAKSGASVAKLAGPQLSTSEIKLKALIVCLLSKALQIICRT